mgnify:CR=1 FL=1
MEVDWIGDTLRVYDSASGIPAYIFAAVLPCSLYSTAPTMNWRSITEQESFRPDL